ncbi:MAG: nitrogenase component 1, partial [Eubacteriales bacterium]|nr:nitrogenase component 1 [Eubacteriales bacterium]
MKTVYFTAAQLAARGSGDIPRELVSSSHLIYSSPAALAFNSPGAEGYGVKRAGLAVPESVMLIVSPGCCGRNTSAISRMPGYEERFFYLTMDETDLVTGRHLKKIPDAVEEICRCLAETGRRPRAVMICITCVDALLGTDMERVCRRAQEKVPGVRVRPCYMYALTREGRKPPMVHVRQSIYELLEPRKKKASSVNLMGFFAPLSPESELPAVLSQAGVRTVRQIGACADYDAFQEMAEANFNLVLNPEARPAAYDLQKRLGIPFIELTRFYQIDRIEAQYAALGRVLQTSFAEEEWKNEAVRAVASFRRDYPDAVFSVGEGMNGNPFELACALVREGFAVREIFGTVSEDSFVWLRLLAALSPGTRVYSNLHPTMLHFGEPDAGSDDALLPVTISIGRDAGWYHPEAPNVQWITDIQPFGYGAVTGLFHALHDAMRARSRGSYSPEITLGKPVAASENPADSSGKP